MTGATLTIVSRNYGSWSLRGWLLCRLAGLEFEVDQLPPDDESGRAELLQLSPSLRVPRLEHDGVAVWGTLAITEYLNELRPEAGLLPAGVAERAHCRSVCDEMHAGFANLRSALPMNLRARHPGFKVFSGAQPDIDRILAIWGECLAAYAGPYLFGARPTAADAMYAPVCTRFETYDVRLDPRSRRYCSAVLALEPMQEWIAAAREEPAEVDELELEMEF
jgi:glutathione S-transferase